MKTKSRFWCLTFLAALLVSSVPTNSRPQQQSPVKESAVITGVEVGQIGIHTIVRVNGKGHLVFHAERLSNSDRLVLDFKNARLNLAQSAVSSALMPIRGIRVGQFKPDVARVGASKPAPAIFYHALRELDALAEEALYIDDLRENVATAVRLGMTGFHFISPSELLSEFSRLGLCA